MKSFASDNYAGAHPEVMAALQRANADHAASYGADEYTQRATQKIRDLLGEQAQVFFVYNGTGANVLGLSAIVKSYHAILCAEVAHINVDESTAPEKFTGCKLVTLPTIDGKITAQQVDDRIQRVDDQHHPQFGAISISQATEYGTVYAVNEIQALSEVARRHNLYLHMDGARLANAAVSLNKSFKEFTTDAGVDVLSFGGTKNGLMFGEAVVFLRPGLAPDFKFIRKQGMQLHSKMRYISAQFEALLTDDLWKRNATHANAMARLLAQGLAQIPHVKITQRVDANGVFAILPEPTIAQLRQTFPFYVWNEKTHECRLMCSWDTTEEEVQRLCDTLAKLI
jgi:threonine aldolase